MFTWMLVMLLFAIGIRYITFRARVSVSHRVHRPSCANFDSAVANLELRSPLLVRRRLEAASPIYVPTRV